MGEQFFLSVEFENLVDLSALAVSIFLFPLGWRGARSMQTAFARWCLSAFFSVMVFHFGLQALRSGYHLASNLPFSAGYFLPLLAITETLGAGLLLALLVSGWSLVWARWSLGVVIAAALVSGAAAHLTGASGLPLIIRGQYAFAQTPLAWMGFLRAFLLAAAGVAVLRAGVGFPLPRRLGLVALGLAAWQFLNLPVVLGASIPAAAVSSSAGQVAGLLAVVGGIVIVYDFNDVRWRSFAMRVFVLAFVVLVTFILTLSFNYLLRVRLLDEALVRYRGEGRKIAADITETLDELAGSLSRLTEPAVFQFFSTRFHSSSAAVSELGLDLVRGYIPREFNTVSFTDPADLLLLVYSAYGGVPGAAPALTASQMNQLWAAPGRVLIFDLDQSARGGLISDAGGIRTTPEAMPESQPSVMLAAAVSDRSGRALGFVKGVIPVQSLLSHFAGYDSSSGWDFIATETGTILAHPRADYVGYQIDRRGSAWEDALGAKRWFQLDLPGGRIYLALYPVDHGDWVLARAVSTTTIVESTRKLRGATLLMLLFTMFVAVVIAAVVSVVLTRQNVAIERMGFEVERKRVLEDRNRVLDLKNRELAGERRRIETILLSIGEGVVVLDPEGQVTFMNRAARRILKDVPAPQAVPVGAGQLGIPELEYELARLREAGQEPGSVRTFICRGGEVDLRVTLSEVRADDGSLVATVLALQDITELMKVDRLKTEIVSIVSHSLRTPLTSIKSYTEILLSHPGKAIGARELQHLGVIDRSADKLTRIVTNLLDLSKISSGQMQYRFEPTDIERLAAEAVELVSGAARAKDIGVDFQADADLPSLPIDRLKFRQVLDNLLGNAVKFTPSGGKIGLEIRVVPTESLPETVRAENWGPPGHCVLIRVRDSGSGIRQQNLERIFDRFFQDDYVRQSSEGGTGLGLAITREFVQAHGGRIWAESPAGSGAILSVALPLPQAAVAA